MIYNILTVIGGPALLSIGENPKDQQELWKSQHKYEIIGNKWDPWNVAGVPWETWKNLNMEKMEPDARQSLIETMNETRANDPEWIYFKNRLNNL